MATTITQKPEFNVLPVGQEIMFAVENTNIVSNKIRVKFVAEVHISDSTIPVTASSADVIGTFKTTHNNVGVGMFDLSSIVQSYVTTDNLATTGSQYKGMSTTLTTQHPVHLIDKFTKNANAIRYLVIQFSVEYYDDDDTSSTYNQIVRTDFVNSDLYTLFNGYLTYSDQLEWSNTGFGYDISRFQIQNPTTGQFLSNAPLTQYATADDYGTFAYLTKIGAGSTVNGYVGEIRMQCYDSVGGLLGSSINVTMNGPNGGYGVYSANIRNELLYFGCFPANLRNWSTIFQTQYATGNLDHYDVRCYTAGGTAIYLLKGVHILS